jgi:hypothetical protein
MTPIFVSCDVVAFLIQLIGGVLSVSSMQSTAKLGYNIAKAGLAVQVACFGFFLLTSVRFHFVSKRFKDNTSDRDWRVLLLAVNAACTLIFVCINPYYTPDRLIPQLTVSSSDPSIAWLNLQRVSVAISQRMNGTFTSLKPRLSFLLS